MNIILIILAIIIGILLLIRFRRIFFTLFLIALFLWILNKLGVFSSLLRKVGL